MLKSIWRFFTHYWQFSIALPSILDTVNRNWGSERFLKSDYDTIKAEVDSIFTAEFPPIPAIGPSITEERVNV